MDDVIYSKLLANLPLNLNGVYIYSPTLKEIAEVGYDIYNARLMNLAANVKDFGIEVKENDDVSVFDVILTNMLYQEDNRYRNMIFDSFKMFCKSEVTFDIQELHFKIGNGVIDKHNFEQFVYLLKLCNCLSETDEKEEHKPANNKAEEIKQKIMKAREKRRSGSNYLTIFDLVSVLAANGNNLNLLNVWDLNVFQFNDSFARMQIIEEYDIGIRSLLAGAKSEDVRLKHYIRKIDNVKKDDSEQSNTNKNITTNKVSKIN